MSSCRRFSADQEGRDRRTWWWRYDQIGEGVGRRAVLGVGICGLAIRRDSDLNVVWKSKGRA